MNLTQLMHNGGLYEPVNFQSPFSGAFESYQGEWYIKPIREVYFQSPFSGAFESYVRAEDDWGVTYIIFQSPFSGAFESYRRRYLRAHCIRPFNLHFQEPLNLTSFYNDAIIPNIIPFQSPFSGAFESYVAKAIRRFAKDEDFQSPFSGAFESYV